MPCLFEDLGLRRLLAQSVEFLLVEGLGFRIHASGWQVRGIHAAPLKHTPWIEFICP